LGGSAEPASEVGEHTFKVPAGVREQRADDDKASVDGQADRTPTPLPMWMLMVPPSTESPWRRQAERPDRGRDHPVQFTTPGAGSPPAPARDGRSPVPGISMLSILASSRCPRVHLGRTAGRGGDGYCRDAQFAAMSPANAGEAR
jgi:hypothetical protein